MKKCKTCKYWETERQNLPNTGACRRIPGPDDLDRKRSNSEDIHDELAIVEDGSGYYAALITKGDFGCILHEGRGQ